MKNTYLLSCCILQTIYDRSILVVKNGKMVSGSGYYRALESVSIASALSTAITIYPCQIRVHWTLTVLNSQLLTAQKKEWWPATADSLPQALLFCSETLWTTFTAADLAITSAELSGVICLPSLYCSRLHLHSASACTVSRTSHISVVSPRSPADMCTVTWDTVL